MPEKHWRQSVGEIIGKTIKDAYVLNDSLFIETNESEEFEIFDDGQSCCERRYLKCDDEMSNIIGGKILSIEEKIGPSSSDDEGYTYYDQVFIEVKTDKGFINLNMHNEHNGFYGCFSLRIKKVENDQRRV